jgi:glycosyltransferase involved in cell wall biosynthesis
MEINYRKPIVYMGRLAKSKGVDLLLHAYYELYKRNSGLLPPLWIIGGNNLEINALRKDGVSLDKIIELENKNLIFWWGHLPHKFLPYILRHCAIFCFTSIYEPGGRTILEAMACGLPVIASPQGLAEEVIENYENGIIIQERSPTIWADTIEMLLKNKKIAQKIGKNAKKTVKEKFLIAHFQERHWDIYKKYFSSHIKNQPKI